MSKTSIKKLFFSLWIGWTIVIGSLLIWNLKIQKHSIKSTLLSEARSFFKLLVTVRRWNAQHGGVYVPVTEKDKPNPYLHVPHREVVTNDGRVLTLINPAYMTRQIAEIASKDEQVQFHITSLNPIRAVNKPYPWEEKALRQFSKGEKTEYFEWDINSKGNSYFRYIGPLWTEKVCLKCHAPQGYSKGSLRGGISITIPINTVLLASQKHVIVILLGHFIIWVLGSLGLFLSARYIKKRNLQRENLLKNLQQALSEVKTLKGLIPICASCKKIRTDKGYWEQIEKYISEHSEAEFSHSICPECGKKLYPEIADKLSHEEL